MSLIYGINPVYEAISSGKTINKLYIQKGNKEIYKIIQKAKEKKIVIVEVDKLKLDKMITVFLLYRFFSFLYIVELILLIGTKLIHREMLVLYTLHLCTFHQL